MSVTDLVTLSVLQAITPSLREAVSAIARGDRKGMITGSEVIKLFSSSTQLSMKFCMLISIRGAVVE